MSTSTHSVRGFTLIELIVSVAIFSIVMLLVTSSYLTLINASRSVRSSTSAANSISAAFDSMIRDIRTGTCTTSSCPGSSTSALTFTNTNGCMVTYALANGALQRTTAASGSCTAGTEVLTDTTAITLQKLTFNSRLYTVTNTAASSTAQQLLVTTELDGTAIATKVGATPQQFSLESSATTRAVNILP